MGIEFSILNLRRAILVTKRSGILLYNAPHMNISAYTTNHHTYPWLCNHMSMSFIKCGKGFNAHSTPFKQ